MLVKGAPDGRLWICGTGTGRFTTVIKKISRLHSHVRSYPSPSCALWDWCHWGHGAGYVSDGVLGTAGLYQFWFRDGWHPLAGYILLASPGPGRYGTNWQYRSLRQTGPSVWGHYIEPTQLAALMMTSSNGNFFRVTGHLCGEFTGHRWIPHTKASDAEL